MTNVEIFSGFLIYVLAGRACLKRIGGRWRAVFFGLLNLTAVWILLNPPQNLLIPRKIGIYAIYVALVTFQFFMLIRFANKPGWRPWLAFFTPIVALIIIKYIPHFSPFWSLIKRQSFTLVGEQFLGISYLAFRASHLVLEVRNGVVKTPGFWEYLSFCFFLPTMSVGPISAYSQFQKGFASPNRAELPLGRSSLRIIIGLIKFLFLSHPCHQLAYDGLLLDGHSHRPTELAVAAIFFYLYLYCNFSGFCDIAIGLAGLLGFPVEENFNEPLKARNLQELWNRWHMTLSRYMRDVVFTPLCKWLITAFGIQTNAAVTIAIIVVYLLIGIWHGVGWNYFFFGVANALGVVAVHYYTIALKKWLGRDGFKSYQSNHWIHAVAVAATFCYFAASLFFFANTISEMKQIFSILK